MQVIITMAGLGQRFKDQSDKDPIYNEPKPFIPIHNKYIIEHLAEQFPSNWKLFFVVNEDLNQKYIDFLNARFINSMTLKTKYSDRGPIDTVLAAFPYLNLQEPTMVSYCDYTLRWNPLDFEQATAKVDAAVVGYTGFNSTFLGPNSYCHYLVIGEWVTELQEKKLYTGDHETDWTSCGLYYFKSAEFLKQALQEQFKQNLNYNGKEFYTSLAIQAMLNKNSDLKVLNYPIATFIQLGTPFDVNYAITNNLL